MPAASTSPLILAPNTSAAGPGQLLILAAAHGRNHVERAIIAAVPQARLVSRQGMEHTAVQQVCLPRYLLVTLPNQLLETDCINKLLTLPACADQSMDMYPWPYYPRFFCCLPGLIAIIPYSGDGGLCLPADQNVPATAILTASQQIGVGISRTSMVPVVSATNPPSSGTITDYNPSTPTSSTTTCTTSPCVTDAATTTNPNKSNNSENGLSNSAIGGIAAAGVVIALLILIYCSKRRSKKRQRKLDSTSRMDVFPTPTVTQHSAAKPMYVSSGQPYFTPQHARDTETSSTPAPHQPANTQSPVPANAVPVSPLSSRVASPPPPYGSTPAAQYGELHGQAVGPGELDGNVVGGRGQGWWRTDGRESVTGRQEM
ncbi:hypothetical protein V495_07596 [Pseudogymnoascus sp. VKM F-4514 (FW-929)]|nr:hypothetical protein V495_07596 [Pseudogymnoascus sp. VKM F-4514 (FW-929)]KFY55735.1 hypothetical protein V497_06763 [Pseudogymnoascus sp. VKM F-4516 (FW-969)]